jgi:hypothetical protein
VKAHQQLKAEATRLKLGFSRAADLLSLLVLHGLPLSFRTFRSMFLNQVTALIFTPDTGLSAIAAVRSRVMLSSTRSSLAQYWPRAPTLPSLLLPRRPRHAAQAPAHTAWGSDTTPPAATSRKASLLAPPTLLSPKRKLAPRSGSVRTSLPVRRWSSI